MHDASQKNSALALERWAREIAQQGTFVAPDTHTKSVGDEYERSARYIRVWGVTGAVFGDFEQER